MLQGLAALVEHELCVRAPLAFAGSPHSTWANLIGARRVAAGRRNDEPDASRAAYVDLHSGAFLPACAAGSSGPHGNRTWHLGVTV